MPASKRNVNEVLAQLTAHTSEELSVFRMVLYCAHSLHQRNSTSLGLSRRISEVVSFDAGLGALETLEPRFVPLLLEVLGATPWNQRDETFQYLDPRVYGQSEPNILLFLEERRSFAGKLVREYDSDLHGDAEYVPWNMWQCLRIEALNGDGYLKRIGETIHFGSAKILGISSKKGSVLDDFHRIRFEIYDRMKTVLAPLYSGEKAVNKANQR